MLLQYIAYVITLSLQKIRGEMATSLTLWHKSEAALPSDICQEGLLLTLSILTKLDKGFSDTF